MTGEKNTIIKLKKNNLKENNIITPHLMSAIKITSPSHNYINEEHCSNVSDSDNECILDNNEKYKKLSYNNVKKHIKSLYDLINPMIHSLYD
jgi:hypothetical protein